MSKKPAGGALPLQDAPARERIARDFKRNLLVEAGAGSGKTHMMALRMAGGIASGDYVLDGMAAVTFTRKAASELRGRFQQALEDELQKSAGDPARAARVSSALGNLERFFAGTIHAFCAHLLRQHPVEAGLSPVFDELDETQDKQMRQQGWRDFLRQARAEGNPLLQELRDAGITPKELDDAFATVCEHEDVSFPEGAAPKPSLEKAWKDVDAFARALGALIPPQIDEATTCKIQQRWQQFSRTLHVTRSRRASGASLARALAPWDHSSGVILKWWDSKATAKKAAEIVDAFRANTVTPFMTAWRRYLYRLMVQLLCKARGYAAAERRRRNTLNYNDLLLLTARLFRDRPDVRAQLQQKVRWLFVDEFQDTDPLQAEIIFLLAGDCASSSDWRQVSLLDGALFVVGDPKQSIYRFRRADIDIYNQVRGSIEKAPNGSVELLTSNFRSTRHLCEFANGVFATMFPITPTPVSPAFAPLNPKPDAEDGDPGVYRLSIPARGKEATSLEADAIARYIRAEIDAGRRHAGDFLILTRKRKPLTVYMEALEALRVPLEVSGAGAFAESEEVGELTALLRVLGDPQDAVALVGVLRGAMFGVSDRELWEWKQSGGRFSIFAGGEEGPKGRVGTALESLRQYHRWTRVMPLPAAVERILEHTGYLALAATSPDGVEAGDLVHAVDRVRRVMEDGGTLAEAAASLESDGETFGEIESLPLEPGRSDVVRVMNLHKAKGLEADVVFLADPGGGFPKRVSRRIVREEGEPRGYLVIDRGPEDKPWMRTLIAEPDGWEKHVEAEREFLDGEEIRLLYVAATRAAKMLVVGRCASDGGPWAELEPFLQGAPELKVPAARDLQIKWKADVSPKARAKATERREAAHAAARQASWSAASVTGEAKHIAKLARDAEAAADDPTRVVTADTRERRADAGMAWGTLVHGLLEHAMRHEKVEDADLRRLAMWLTMETPDLRPIIDEAIATVKEVMQSDFWKQAKGAEHLVETPFAVQTSSRDVLFGMIDLMFASKDGWKLVDYKTDATMPVGGDPAYAYQLKAYEDAMKRCKVPTSGAVLHPVRRGSA